MLNKATVELRVLHLGLLYSTSLTFLFISNTYSDDTITFKPASMKNGKSRKFGQVMQKTSRGCAQKCNQHDSVRKLSHAGHCGTVSGTAGCPTYCWNHQWIPIPAGGGGAIYFTVSMRILSCDGPDVMLGPNRGTHVNQVLHFTLFHNHSSSFPILIWTIFHERSRKFAFFDMKWKTVRINITIFHESSWTMMLIRI